MTPSPILSQFSPSNAFYTHTDLLHMAARRLDQWDINSSILFARWRHYNANGIKRHPSASSFAKIFCVAWRLQVSYVSRWRGGLPLSAPLSSSSSTAGSGGSCSSGYCSNCSELHDSKTPLRLLDLQRRQRTCSSDDVKRMTSLNITPTDNSDSRQPSVKHELNSSLLVSIEQLFIHIISSLIYLCRIMTLAYC